jgi:hypothetical protein
MIPLLFCFERQGSKHFSFIQTEHEQQLSIAKIHDALQQAARKSAVT